MKKKLQAARNKIKKSWKQGKIQSGLKFSLLSFFGGLTLMIIAFHFAYRGRIYPGVTAAGLPIGNRTQVEAVKMINQRVSGLTQPKLALVSEEQEWLIDLAEFEFNYDIEATVKKAYLVGREGNLIQTLLTKALAWFKGVDLELEYSLNQEAFKNWLAIIEAEVSIPVIQPAIRIINQTARVEQGKPGQALDQKELASQLHTSLKTYNFRPLELPLIHSSLLLTEEEMAQVQVRAEKFIGQKIILTFEENKWELDDQALVNLLSFKKDFDQVKIASQTTELALAIDRPPQDASFQFAGGKAIEFKPAVDGWELDQEKTQTLIEAALTKLEEGEPVETIQLIIKVTPPLITIDQVNNLGIKELLGRGISYFWGSIPSRIHNIVLASSNLNGILIPPGESFSLNQSLGEVSPATGYQSAFIIKEGQTILGDGGGVCQVSTTLFRAALDSGLPILERHPHSYRVSYYEQGGFGPGLDATVWIPGIDLRFKNDTPGHILIQTQVDTQTKTLTFELYGTNDGRQVSLSKPRVWAQTAPPEDLYQDDPSLPLGTIKQVEHAIWGAKVSVDWRVIRGDEVLQDRTFYSTYQPWQAVYLRGTAQ